MNIQQEIEMLTKEVESQALKTSEQLESFRLEYLSKKGKIPALFQRFREVDASERKEVGRVLNVLKRQDSFKVKHAA